MTLFRRFFAPSIRRRILAGFAIVAVLVLVMAAATFYQLNQVRTFSEQIIPNSSQMGHLQSLGLATSALDADLERFLVIRGAEYRDSVLQDLTDVTEALDQMQLGADVAELPAVQELQTIATRLQTEITALLDIETTGAATTDVNQRIVEVYADIDRVKQLQQTLSAETLTRLQTTAATQEYITSGVITQTALLGLAVFVIAVVASLLINRTMRPIGELTETATVIAAGDLTRTAPVQSQDEIGTLAATFNQMTGQLRDLIGSLEDRIEARTEQLRASADVGRTAVSVLEPDELLRRVVNLITDRFGFYYTAVFIIDSSGRHAILREATGEAGRILKQRGHQLEVGGQSMVGYVTEHQKARIALDVGEEAVRFANPLLPDTRSEIALPLVVGDRVLGALDVQSTQEAAFDEASAAVLQSMADQIAIAWNNALSYTHSEAIARRSRALFAASREVGRLQADLAETIRATLRAAANILDYECWRVLTFNEIRTTLISIAAHNWPDAEKALDVQAQPDHPLIYSVQRDTELFIRGTDDVRLHSLQMADLRGLICVPIKARDTIVGALAFGRTHGSELTDDDLEVGRSLASLVAVAFENSNLVETTQHTLRELDEINRSLTGQAWEKFVRRQSEHNLIWVSRSDQLQPQLLPEVSEALAVGRIATRSLDDARQLGVAVPIKLRDVPVGALRLIVPKHRWNAELAAALGSLAGHVAQAAENARLLTETEDRLTRERALTEATEKVRRRSDVEAILQTAATELARYLNASHIAVRMAPEHSPSDGNGQ
jgi:GAF domain-containing protein/HAMP domain-containing protein